MKTSTLINLITLAATGLAAPTKRQVATIQAVLQQVQAGVGQLDQAVTQFNADPSQVLSSFQQLQQTINQGTQTIGNSQSLGLTDLLQLQGLQSNFQTSSQKLATDFSNAKPKIQAAGLCGLVQQNLNGFQSSTGNFLQAITSKIPSQFQSVAQQQTAPFMQLLQQAQQNFAPGNCVNSGGSATAGGSIGGVSSGSASGTSVNGAGTTSTGGSLSGTSSTGTTSSGLSSTGTTSSGFTQ